MLAWLAIDYGAASTRAVLVWPDGRATVVSFGGADELSSAVHVSSSGIVAGAVAWQRAQTDPDGFVLAPLRVAGDQVTVAGVVTPVADMITATLRQVGEEASRIVGAPVEDVRLVVPAGWGPRRRTWLRTAARRAGLPVSRLVEAPVAAGAQLEAPAGTVVVIDVGAGCEASVVAGGEVLSTLADADCGGDGIDAALAVAVTGASLDELPGQQRWPTLAGLRAAKHALTEHPAVTLPLPGGRPPVVVTADMVRQAALSVFERAGQLAADAIINADLQPNQVASVQLIGAAAATPGAADMVATKLGTLPHVASQPATVALIGAAEADADALSASPDGAGSFPRLPPLRRIAALALPWIFSLLLYGHFVFTAGFYNGTPTSRREGYYVLAVWGELTVASVLAAITFVQAASLLTGILDHRAGQAGGPGVPNRITSGLGLAAAAAAAVASLYAITAAVYFAYPIDMLLRWALLPILPALGCVLVMAAITWHKQVQPYGGWDGFLAFPVSSIVATAVGTFAVALEWHTGLPWWANDWKDLIGYGGGLLMGIGITCALVRHLAVRIGLAVLLGFFSLIISRSGPDILAVLYAVAVASWWAQRAWSLARTTRSVPPG
jgi:hypothetical protein